MDVRGAVCRSQFRRAGLGAAARRSEWGKGRPHTRTGRRRQRAEIEAGIGSFDGGGCAGRTSRQSTIASNDTGGRSGAARVKSAGFHGKFIHLISIGRESRVVDREVARRRSRLSERVNLFFLALLLPWGISVPSECGACEYSSHILRIACLMPCRTQAAIFRHTGVE